MKDAHGVIIYVGKAKNLRKRVSSYFKAGSQTFKTTVLASTVVDIDTVVTRTEIEALLLENTLIKAHQPRFNVMLKDDKTYPYIKVTCREPFPRVFKTRIRLNDGARYFGPYPSDGVLNRIVALLDDVFAYRKCGNPLPNKVCLSYHLKRCVGPCEFLDAQAEHGRIIEQVLLVLNGEGGHVITQLGTQMHALSAQQRFEEAALIRDRILALKKMHAVQHVVLADTRDMDIFAFAAQGRRTYISVLEYRGGRLVNQTGYHGTRATADQGLAEYDFLNQALVQHYLVHETLPAEIVVEKNPADAHLLAQWLEGKYGHKVEILEPQKGVKRQLVLLAKRNALEKVRQGDRSMLADKADAHELLGVLKSEFNLRQLPRHIECIDISNLGGRVVTGATVAFYDGRPEKRFYRHYSITLPGNKPDDYQAMREVVKRRYAQNELPKPHLLLVDGGAGHVAVVLETLNRLHGHETDVLGLAKQEENIVHPDLKKRTPLSPGHPAHRLLLALRDEAHRFSNRLRKTQFSHVTLRSTLDEIPGIGKKRLATVLSKFGSVENIAKASLAQLRLVEGLPKMVADNIYRHFHASAAKE